MGRGSSNTSHATAATLRGGNGGGEISSLYGTNDDGVEVTQLSAVSNTAARATGAARDDDDRADARAIAAIAKRLRPRNQGLSSDDLTEKATDFYAGMCQKATAGKLPSAAFAQFAALVGEDAEALKSRIERGQAEVAKAA